MKTLIFTFVLILTSLAPAQTIVCAPDAPPNVKLAAKEIRRYLYLRTGQLLPIAPTGQGITLQIDPTLAPQQYRLKTTGDTLTLSGHSDVALLYAAYDLIEKLGVRFYLHGDSVPDQKIPFVLPKLDETHKPLFDIRGIQPFHDFQEGPDWWNQDDYIAYVSQLAKMRLNFIGLHCYPQGGVGPEPLVWIGRPSDCDANGNVTFSYPAQWASTDRGGMWGYASMNTSDYAGGAGLLFPADAYAPDVHAGLIPRPATPEQSNELFNRVARQMNTVFTAARKLGVKTCIGTETPLTIPTLVRARSTNPRELYTGIFKRIAAACPVDYYWLWTPEGWTWSGNKPEQFQATTADIQAALDALNDLGNPFTLATSGWVLGPAHDRAALDAFLPKSSPMSCINRKVGHDGVEPAFATIQNRPKWAIPWMENDPNLVGPQPFAARMRYDAADARRFACTGLLGIHWRTKAMAMNLAALASAAWDQSWLPATYDLTPPKPSKTTDGAHGGSVASFSAPVAGTQQTPPSIYQTVRYNLTDYTLNLPDGLYTLTLQFNEPHYTAPNKRVFGVKIQDKQVIEHLDLFARLGQNKALDLTFPDIPVTTGTLRIDFTKEVEFPCIAGLVITGNTKPANQLPPESITRKINCGGGAVADYEADPLAGGTIPTAPRNRAMPIEDFYIDFARANFGDPIAQPAGRILARIDGVNLPEASIWKAGPGNLPPIPQPWDEIKKRYAFVNELAALRPQIQGPGNLERFDYWLNTYHAMSAMAEAGCLRGQFDRAMTAKNYPQALALRIDLAKTWTRLLTLQTSIVSTPGELGTIANLEQHSRRHQHFLDAHDAALAKALGKPLPPETQPDNHYTGPPKLILPTLRTQLNRGQSLTLKIIALDNQPVNNVTLHISPLGKNTFKVQPAEHIARAVYSATLPPSDEDFEYFIQAQTASNKTLVWPPTAPDMNQTVVVTDPTTP